MVDEDLTAVRDLLQRRTQTPAPTWADVVARRSQARTPAARRAWPVVAMAAVLALLASGAFSVVIRMYADRGPDGAPPPPAFPAPTPTASARAVGPYPDAEALDPTQALADLIAVAPTAVPLTVQPGQVLYRHIVGWVIEPSPNGIDPQVQTPAGMVTVQDRSMWIDPEGMITLSLMMGDTNATTMPKSNWDQDVADARRSFTESGPSLNNPTPQWLSTLPTTAAEWRSLLTPPAQNRSSKWTADHDIWVNAEDFLFNVDPFLPGPQRIGLYQALSNLSNLSAAAIDADGRRLIALRYREAPIGTEGTQSVTTRELLFDAQTGRVAGGGSLADTPSGRYQSLWTYKIVNTVGERE